MTISGYIRLPFIKSGSRSVLKLLPVLVLGVALSLSGCASHTSKQEALHLNLQTIINSETRFSIRPVTWMPHTSVTFKLVVESTQNPALLSASPDTYTLLLDQDETPFSSVTWAIQHEEPYKLTGLLTFPISSQTKDMSLMFYTDDPFSVSWTLPSD